MTGCKLHIHVPYEKRFRHPIDLSRADSHTRAPSQEFTADIEGGHSKLEYKLLMKSSIGTGLSMRQ